MRGTLILQVEADSLVARVLNKAVEKFTLPPAAKLRTQLGMSTSQREAVTVLRLLQAGSCEVEKVKTRAPLVHGFAIARDKPFTQTEFTAAGLLTKTPTYEGHQAPSVCSVRLVRPTKGQYKIDKWVAGKLTTEIHSNPLGARALVY